MDMNILVVQKTHSIKNIDHPDAISKALRAIVTIGQDGRFTLDESHYCCLAVASKLWEEFTGCDEDSNPFWLITRQINRSGEIRVSMDLSFADADEEIVK